MIILDQLISIPALYSVIIISFFVALLINIIYKFMTDQKRLKEIHNETKKYQESMKKLKDDPKKMMDVQKDAMKLQMEMFTQTMKPTIVTMLPILFVFAWMSTHFAYAPIMPGQEFTTTMLFKEVADGSAEILVPEGIRITGNAVVDINNNKNASWHLRGEKGEYLLQYRYNNQTYDREVLITQESSFKEPVKNINEDNVNKIIVEHDKNILLDVFGFKIGWLGTYIIFSLIFSMGLRKLMRLY